MCAQARVTLVMVALLLSAVVTHLLLEYRVAQLMSAVVTAFLMISPTAATVAMSAFQVALPMVSPPLMTPEGLLSSVVGEQLPVSVVR